MRIVFLILLLSSPLTAFAWQIETPKYIAMVWDYFYIKTLDTFIKSPICNKSFLLKDTAKLEGHLSSYGALPKYVDNVVKPELTNFYWAGSPIGATYLIPLSNIRSPIIVTDSSDVLKKAIEASYQAWLAYVEATYARNSAFNIRTNPLCDSINNYAKFLYDSLYLFEVNWFNDSTQKKLASNLLMTKGSVICLEKSCWQVEEVVHWLLKKHGNTNAVQRSVIAWKRTILQKKMPQRKIAPYTKRLISGQQLRIRNINIQFSSPIMLNDECFVVKVDARLRKRTIFKNIYLKANSSFCIGSLCIKVSKMEHTAEGKLILTLLIESALNSTVKKPLY